MIIYENKGYETRSDKPNENWMADYPELPQPLFVVPDGSELAQKVEEYYPYYDFVVQDGRLTDITPTERPEPEPEPPSELEQLKQQNKQLMSAARVFCASATTIADDAALQMPDLFPVWEDVLEAGNRLAEGTILQDSGTLYRVVQSGGVVPQEGQPPHGAGMLAVYRPIDQGHAGTEDDPIPWVYGMDCKAGQYFSYEGHVYKVAEGGDMIPCIWAPGTPGLWQWELVK